MNDKNIKSAGRFIPTLTEVIEEADLLNQQQVDKQQKTEPVLERSSNLVESVKPAEEKDSAFIDKVASESVHNENPRPEAEEKSEADGQPVTAGQVFVGNPYPTRSQTKPAEDEGLKEPILAKDEELLQASSNIFSTLSRNPGATPGSLRPSDLMLVALTERIAAKARLRIEKEIEQHIQETIFPLLDNFALQLVSHIQEDLVKVMRESIAQVTREELEWLQKRDQKSSSSR